MHVTAVVVGTCRHRLASLPAPLPTARRDYLAAEGSRYSVVLSADARDTAFQGDVFARPVVQVRARG
jgi:hypothetical protein